MRLRALAACLALSASMSLNAQPPLPHGRANNAVAAGEIGGRWWVFSLLGIDSTKRWSGIARDAFAWSPPMASWQRLPNVPGAIGRLAATAQVVHQRLYLFGGYTVDSTGAEQSVSTVDIWDQALGAWRRGAAIPVPVDDAVSVTWRDSLVYLVSGWHDTDNVQHVQIYDVIRDRWTMATPIPGPGVFGHTGAIAGNEIVFIDGAARTSSGPKYALVRQAWIGTIDPTNPRLIRWHAIAAPRAGPSRYRAAAAACGSRIVFVGGTENPYNYTGIGYDGRPSLALASVSLFDLTSRSWRDVEPAPRATMDHRALVVRGDTAMVVGGMVDPQRVTPDVSRWVVDACAR